MFKSIITLLVMLPLAAFAADEGGSSLGSSSGSGSEYFHQAAAGKREVTPTFAYLTAELKAPGQSVEASGMLLGVSYEQGLTEDIALGATLSYQNYSTEGNGALAGVDAESTGLNDINLFAKASMPAGAGLLKYGADLSLSPGDSKTEANGDSNAYSGGHTVEPYVGYEISKDNCIFGAKLATEFNLTDKKDDDGTETSGGESTTITLLYEHVFNADMRLGVSLDWETVKDTDDGSGPADSMSPNQTLAVYLPTKVGNGLLLPQLAYLMTTDKEMDDANEDFSGFALQVGYRIEL